MKIKYYFTTTCVSSIQIYLVRYDQVRLFKRSVENDKILVGNKDNGILKGKLRTTPKESNRVDFETHIAQTIQFSILLFLPSGQERHEEFSFDITMVNDPFTLCRRKGLCTPYTYTLKRFQWEIRPLIFIIQRTN